MSTALLIACGQAPATQPEAPAPTTAPTEAPAPTEVIAPTEVAPAPTEVPAPTEAPVAEVTTFQIDPARSQASFTLNEVLLGQPTTVKLDFVATKQ